MTFFKHYGIPAFNLDRQSWQLREEIISAIKQVLDSGRFVMDAQVIACEKEIARYVGVDYAVACASGTDALHLALKAIGIHVGDEVITSAFTFAATAEAIAYTGATPVFADIDPETFNLSCSSVAARISSKSKAVIAVHLFGHPAEMATLQMLCREHGLFLLEDCAQAFGALYQGKPIGGIADAGCHSFYPSKNLAACGDGGMITLHDPDHTEILRCLRNHGDIGYCHHRMIGYNSRLDELQAAVLLVKLKYLNEWNNRRRYLAARYDQLLAPLSSVTVPRVRPGCEHIYNQYTIRVPQRDKVRTGLAERGIDSRIYYPRILPEQPAFLVRGSDFRQLYPHALTAAAECLSLPLFPEMSDHDVDKVTQALADVCAK